MSLNSSHWGKLMCAFFTPRKRPGAYHFRQSSRRNEDIMKKPTETDWAELDAMSDEEVHAAALSDPDAQPLTDEDMNRMKRTPRVKIIRRALRLSQEEFAQRYHIPLETLRDWEEGRSEPDALGRASLKVIAREPDVVRDALGDGRGT
jgi:putative transcriptional regulator